MPDYSLPCIATGTCTCLLRSEYGIDWCQIISLNCSHVCPSPSKPHSHYDSKDCNHLWNCNPLACVCSCVIIGGACYYSCDEDYEWNPATQNCELIIVSRRIGEGLVFVEA